MSILCYKISVASRVQSELCASVLADVVVRAVAVHVVPEVVTEDWEEGVVVFSQCEAVLVVAKVVWLPIMPVKPLNCRVHMIPSPGAWLVVAVVSFSSSTHPERGSLSNGDLGEHLRLQPVVDPRVIKFSDPGSGVSSTDEVGRRSRYRLTRAKQEATASRSVLLFHPSIRAAVCVLGHGKACREDKQGEDHVSCRSESSNKSL